MKKLTEKKTRQEPASFGEELYRTHGVTIHKQGTVTRDMKGQKTFFEAELRPGYTPNLSTIEQSIVAHLANANLKGYKVFPFTSQDGTKVLLVRTEPKQRATLAHVRKILEGIKNQKQLENALKK